MMCCFVAILMMYGSGRSRWHCGLIMMIRYGLCHLYEVCCSTIVGGILVRCKTRLQVPDSRVQAWSQQSCLRRDKIQYFGKVLQNSPLTSHKMQVNRAILTMILPCQ